MTTSEALAVVRAVVDEQPFGNHDARAALALIEERLGELEVRDKMRDDGERHLLSEVEARDAHIRELEAALRRIVSDGEFAPVSDIAKVVFASAVGSTRQ